MRWSSLRSQAVSAAIDGRGGGAEAQARIAARCEETAARRARLETMPACDGVAQIRGTRAPKVTAVAGEA
jgi:hypothetical protein